MRVGFGDRWARGAVGGKNHDGCGSAECSAGDTVLPDPTSVGGLNAVDVFCNALVPVGEFLTLVCQQSLADLQVAQKLFTTIAPEAGHKTLILEPGCHRRQRSIL